MIQMMPRDMLTSYPIISPIRRIMMLINILYPPWSSILYQCPFQVRTKTSVDNTADATMNDRHHLASKKRPMPEMIKPAAIMAQTVAVTIRNVSTLRYLENTHDASGQTMPDWSSKNLRL